MPCLTGFWVFWLAASGAFVGVEPEFDPFAAKYGPF